MHFYNKFLVILFLYILLLLNITPLELFPHTHDGTEHPIHNNFSFIPKAVVETPIVNLELAEKYVIDIKVIIRTPIEDFLEITKTSRSPPFI